MDTILETEEYEPKLYEAFAKGKRPPQKYSDAEKQNLNRIIRKFEKLESQLAKQGTMRRFTITSTELSKNLGDLDSMVPKK